MQGNTPAWHREIITATAERALRDMQRESVLAPFYLAGGTGLALHFGHGQSVDLDFFAGELSDPDLLVQKLQPLRGFAVVAKAAPTLHVHVQGVKASFVGYAYPLLFPLAVLDSVQVADPRDIACMNQRPREQGLKARFRGLVRGVRTVWIERTPRSLQA